MGSRLRAIRRERGLTLVALSQLSGLSVSYLSAVEKGVNHPSLQTLAAVTEALQVRIPDVLVEESQPHVRHGRIPDGERGVATVSHPLLRLDSRIVVSPADGGGTCPVSLEGRDLFVFVVAGAVDILVDGATHSLAAGDALDAAAPREASWRTEERAISAWTSCPARQP